MQCSITCRSLGWAKLIRPCNDSESRLEASRHEIWHREQPRTALTMRRVDCRGQSVGSVSLSVLPYNSVPNRRHVRRHQSCSYLRRYTSHVNSHLDYLHGLSPNCTHRRNRLWPVPLLDQEGRHPSVYSRTSKPRLLLWPHARYIKSCKWLVHVLNSLFTSCRTILSCKNSGRRSMAMSLLTMSSLA